MNPEAFIPQWAEGLDCAITVCDADARILFMNERSRQTFARHGDIIGHNLRDYHPPRAVEIIERLLREGATNCYTISKEGKKKLIYQTAFRDENGAVGGLVELSMVIPESMPHYVR